jgi:hypothetical protein
VVPVEDLLPAPDLLPGVGLEAGAVGADPAGAAAGGGVLAGMAEVFTPGSRSAGGGAWRGAGAGVAGGAVCWAKTAGVTANKPATNHNR